MFLPDLSCIERDMAYGGYDLRSTWEHSAEECACACQEDEDCSFFTWDRNDRKCHMKTSRGKRKNNFDSYSGSVNCCKNRGK